MPRVLARRVEVDPGLIETAATHIDQAANGLDELLKTPMPRGEFVALAAKSFVAAGLAGLLLRGPGQEALAQENAQAKKMTPQEVSTKLADCQKKRDFAHIGEGKSNPKYARGKAKVLSEAEGLAREVLAQKVNTPEVCALFAEISLDLAMTSLPKDRPSALRLAEKGYRMALANLATDGAGTPTQGVDVPRTEAQLHGRLGVVYVLQREWKKAQDEFDLGIKAACGKDPASNTDLDKLPGEQRRSLGLMLSMYITDLKRDGKLPKEQDELAKTSQTLISQAAKDGSWEALALCCLGRGICADKEMPGLYDVSTSLKYSAEERAKAEERRTVELPPQMRGDYTLAALWMEAATGQRMDAWGKPVKDLLTAVTTTVEDGPKEEGRTPHPLCMLPFRYLIEDVIMPDNDCSASLDLAIVEASTRDRVKRAAAQ